MQNRKYKIVLLGQSSVGKTNLIKRIVEDDFKQLEPATLGGCFYTLMRQKCYFNFWDTAGQQRYRSMAKIHYRNADAIMLVYDITSKLTLDTIQFWLKEIQELVSKQETMIVLCGNKIDLPQLRQVQLLDVQQISIDKGLQYYEMSAKTGQGVNEFIDSLTNHLIEKQVIRKKDPKYFRSTSSELMRNDPVARRSCCK